MPLLNARFLLAWAIILSSGARLAGASSTPYTQAVLSDAPVLYWNFDTRELEVPQLAPLKQRGVTTENDLFPMGNPAPGRFDHASADLGFAGKSLRRLGLAAQCSGTNGFQSGVLRAAKSLLHGPYALEFWVQVQGLNVPAVNDRQDYFLNFGAGSGNAPAAIFDYKADQIELFAGAGGRTDGGPLIRDPFWHHVLVVYYGNGAEGVAQRVDILLDGVAYERLGIVTARLDLRRLLVGAALPSGVNGFEGRLDELAIHDWSDLASEAEVSARAAELAARHIASATEDQALSYGATVLASKPLLYWNFDEPSGPALQRAPIELPEPDNRHNRLLPAGAWTLDHGSMGSPLNLGLAAVFNGSSYYEAADLEAGVVELPAPWGVEFWMQAQGDNSGNRQDYLVNFGPSGGDNAPAFIYDYNPDLLEIFTTGLRTGAGPTVSDQAWHHVFWVFYGDGTQGIADRADIYLDGIQHAHVRNSFTRPIHLASRMLVGAALPGGVNGFEGRLDELAIYSFEQVATAAALEARVREMVDRHRAAALAPVDPPRLEHLWTEEGLILRWETGGFRLQRNTGLGGTGVWEDYSGGEVSPVLIPEADPPAQFFRLFRPF